MVQFNVYQRINYEKYLKSDHFAFTAFEFIWINFHTMETPEIKAKTRSELATECCICVRTLYRWLKLANINLSKGLIKPKDLQRIYSIFGRPIRKDFPNKS